ncbi:MAG: tetratricopeptide repeat protein [Planctomycetes bacterium]|nr:tetratricopeptide repeat protein [Planctomycetota bacterium]
MRRRRRQRGSQDQPAQTTDPPERGRSRYRRVWIAFTAVVVVASAGIIHQAGQSPRRSPPDAVQPVQTSGLDPDLVVMIARYTDEVRAAPADARRHAVLGAVYEANQLWPEAHACYVNASSLDTDDRTWAYHAAVTQREIGDAAGALAAYRKLAVAYPDFAPLQYRLGHALLESGEHEEAAQAFRKTIALVPDVAHGYLGAGDVKIRTGDFQGAVDYLKRATEIAPDIGMAHYLLGMAYRGLGDMDSARRELARGVGSSTAFLIDRWSDETSQYVVGLARQLDIAADHIEAGRSTEAVVVLEKALTRRPNDINVMNNLSIAYMRLGRVEDAHHILLRAEGIDDQAFMTYINLASCFLRMNRLDEALAYSDRSVELGSAVGRVHFTRGRILTNLGRYEDARAALTTAASLDARNPEVYLMLGEVCSRLQRYVEAKEHFAQGAKRIPDSLPAQVNLCLMSMRLGDLDEAATALAAAQQLAPDHPRVAAMAAQLAELQNR